ncbi:hypothetical protein SASPL_134569 [Salvia splendens]|uniref:Uncharacterized protein n=1 Tax=Salvia splendens TaxID=180675 RepID=A0A8X8WYK4_SALSN|nr:hypothetical protein SASPL_134569 [Salvia splendens]
MKYKMDEDLADSDIDINLDELDGILTFEDSDNDLPDDININDLNDGMDAISLHVDLGRDDIGSEYDGMDAISLYDEFLDKEDEIWVEDEAQESVFMKWKLFTLVIVMRKEGQCGICSMLREI